MWDEITRCLPEYPSAVLTAPDEDGYPFSLRCHPVPDAASHALRVRVPPQVPVQPGPANLLCHKHDEWLWHQRSFLVRGTLERNGGDWLLHPRGYLPGVGYGGPLGVVRFVLSARGAARRYLAARHLPRPPVPWNELAELKHQAFANLAAARAMKAPVVDARPPRHVDPPVNATASTPAGTRSPAAPLAARPRVRSLALLAIATALVLVVAALRRRGCRPPAS
jgi:hypothetical protein